MGSGVQILEQVIWEVSVYIRQGPTKRSLFCGTFRYFWSVRCSLIQRGNREGKKEPLFLAIFRVFFLNFRHFSVLCCWFLLLTDSESFKIAVIRSTDSIMILFGFSILVYNKWFVQFTKNWVLFKVRKFVGTFCEPSVILRQEAFLVPTFRYFPSSVGPWMKCIKFTDFFFWYFT